MFSTTRCSLNPLPSLTLDAALHVFHDDRLVLPTEKTCVSDDTNALTLAVLSEPDTTFFPNLLEGELLLSHPGVEDDEGTTNSGGWDGGVIWNASAISTGTGTPMTWTVFPSSGLILPGER